MKKNNGSGVGRMSLVLVGILGLMIFGFAALASAQSVPTGPDKVDFVSNQTKAPASSRLWNVSGGYISTFNLSTSSQNPRWKGFVGNVTGSFTLDDASGATLFDWTVSSVGGNVYATRNSTSITWGSIVCANITTLEAEDSALVHNASSQDNINSTFNFSGTHDSFFVGSSFFGANSCPTINTYVNDGAQDTSFEEMALYSDPSVIYATIMEPGLVGFDGRRYDFQAIVPENGSQSFAGATPYYLYIELT